MRFALILCFILFFSTTAIADNVDYISQEKAKREAVSIFVSEKINPLQEQKALIVIDVLKDLGNAKLRVFSDRKDFASLEIPLTDKKENGQIVNALEKGKRYFAWWNGWNNGKPLEQGDYFLKIVDESGQPLPEIAYMKLDWELNKPEFLKEEIKNNFIDIPIKINLFKDMKTKKKKLPVFVQGKESNIDFEDIELNQVKVGKYNSDNLEILPSIEKTYKYYPNKFKEKEFSEKVSVNERNVIKRLELLSEFSEQSTFFKRAKTSFEAMLTADEKKALQKLVKEGIVYLGEPYILTIDSSFDKNNKKTETEQYESTELLFIGDFLEQFSIPLTINYCATESSMYRADIIEKMLGCNYYGQSLGINYFGTNDAWLKPDKDTSNEFIEIELDLGNIPETTSYEFSFGYNEKPFEVRNSNLVEDSLQKEGSTKIRVMIPIKKDLPLTPQLCLKTFNKDGKNEIGYTRITTVAEIHLLEPPTPHVKEQKLKLIARSPIKLSEIEAFLITKNSYDMIINKRSMSEKVEELEKTKRRMLYHGYISNRYSEEIEITLPKIIYHSDHILFVAKPFDKKYSEQYYVKDISSVFFDENLIIPEQTNRFFVEKYLTNENGNWIDKYKQTYLLDVTYHLNNAANFGGDVFFISNNTEFLVDDIIITSTEKDRGLEAVSRIKNLPLPIKEEDIDKEHEFCIKTISKDCKKFRIQKTELSQEELAKIYEEQKNKWGCKRVTNNAQKLNMLILQTDFFNEDEPETLLDEIIPQMLYDNEMSFSKTKPFSEYFNQMDFWKMRLDTYSEIDFKFLNESMIKEYCPIALHNKLIIKDYEEKETGVADYEKKTVFISFELIKSITTKINEIALHETGHSFCTLMDEYVYRTHYVVIGKKLKKIIDKRLKEVPNNCFNSQKECEESYVKLMPKELANIKSWCYLGCTYDATFRQWENSIMRYPQEPPFVFNPISEQICREKIKAVISS